MKGGGGWAIKFKGSRRAKRKELCCVQSAKVRAAFAHRIAPASHAKRARGGVQNLRVGLTRTEKDYLRTKTWLHTHTHRHRRARACAPHTHTPHAKRHTPHATRHTPHATRHMPHVTRHMPHVTRHTSHGTRAHTSSAVMRSRCFCS